MKERGEQMKQKRVDKSIDMKRGQQFPLTIKRLGINGEGVGYFKKQVVFVPGALPDEEVVAEVTKVNPRFAEAKVVKIRKRSKERIAPPCPVYDQCGGCQLQHMNYAATLREKRDIVRQAFERHTKLNVEKLAIHDTIGMEDPWDYRNKSQLQVGKRGEEVIAGLYAMNSHKLIDLTQCKVQHSATNKATEVVKQILADLNVSIYNERKHAGDVRTIVTRVGFATGQIQIVLVTTKEQLPRKEAIVAEIKKRMPEVTSIIQNINGQKTSLIFGEKTVHLAGEEVIEEKLGDLSFELSARAFFQLNPVQTVKLYDVVKKAAALTGKEKVVDAYCGVGTIGLWLAREAAEVRGMDVIEASIEDAKANAKAHDFHHVRYEVGKAETLMPRWQKEGWKPDVVVVDPPRTGCDDMLLQTILEVKPKKMVYVSCNPSTLAKDVDRLCKKGYKVRSVQPVDMFPWTAQVESVTELVREK